MGPLAVKLGRSAAKRYVSVFTCLATTAVYSRSGMANFLSGGSNLRS